MTSNECMQLKPGTTVRVYWPGSNTGTGSKLAVVRVVNKTGTTVGVNVARTTPGGEYTGKLYKSVRWFPSDEILGVECE